MRLSLDIETRVQCTYVDMSVFFIARYGLQLYLGTLHDETGSPFTDAVVELTKR